MAKKKKKNPATDEPTLSQDSANEQPADERPADEQTDKDKSVNVIVEVLHAIAFDGVHISPKIDDPRGGKPPTITPVKAVIPRNLAESYGPKYVKVIGDAPDDAKIGLVAE
ncbi:MAG TPA: hypothetical protein VMY35_00215 [Phycisphaerae bacterium]|nr:hypothetical protein [Phycisphaerae bacterium]